LQIKEFRIMGLSINDSVHSCLFFFLTGLHFFHLLFGLLLLCLFFWGCSFPFKIYKFINLRVSEVHLFYNLQLFYWHFLEILWLFIFLIFYNLFFLLGIWYLFFTNSISFRHILHLSFYTFNLEASFLIDNILFLH
jgi:heme/copper-type cytochrome/quinol oxidase subunit 3